MHNTGDDTFSQDHKRILRDTWNVLSADKQNKGIVIFLQIFHERPDIKELFPFKDLSDEALLHNPLFRSHAMRFMHAVDITIQNLDALDLALIPVLHQLGRRHVTIAGFRLEMLPVFMSSLLHVEKGLGNQCSNDVCEAWVYLANFIANKITEGYQEEVMK